MKTSNESSTLKSIFHHQNEKQKNKDFNLNPNTKSTKNIEGDKRSMNIPFFVRSSFLCWKGKSNSLGRFLCPCVCFFLIGSAADVETGRVGFVGLVQMSTLLRIMYSKPNFYCWPNDISSVKLFTWEKNLTKLLKISSHGTIYFFFGWIKKFPELIILVAEEIF